MIFITCVTVIILLLAYSFSVDLEDTVYKRFETRTQEIIRFSNNRAIGRVLLLAFSIILPVNILLFKLLPNHSLIGFVSMVTFTIATIVTLMYKLRPVIADRLFDSSYLLYVKYEQEEKQEEEKLRFKRLAKMRYEEEKEERIKELSK